MNGFVKCWHCGHYIWFSDDSENLSAICDIKKRRVECSEDVCKEFVLGKGIHAKRNVPDYCVHYWESVNKKTTKGDKTIRNTKRKRE